MLGTEIAAVAAGGEDDDATPSVDRNGALLGDVDPAPLVADGLWRGDCLAMLMGLLQNVILK